MRCSSSNSDYCLFTRLGITSYYLDMSHTLAKCGPAEFSMPVKTEREISGAELTSNVKLRDSDEQANLTSPPSPVFFSSRGQIITTTEVAIDASSNLRFVHLTQMYLH